MRKTTLNVTYLWILSFTFINFSLGFAQSPSALPAGGDELTITIPGAVVEKEDETKPDQPAMASNPGIGHAIEGLIPATGNTSVDSALSTFAGAVGSMIEGLIKRLPQIVIALLMLGLTGLVASSLQRFVKGVFKRMKLRQSLQDLFAQLIYVAIWFAGVLMACSIIFPGFGAAELVGTAGLISIAVGFAFQDIFENFFAGILILWRFPFEIDDFIEIQSEDIMGKVEDIWIRMTLIRLTTGELVTVPNAIVYKSPIRILTNRDTRRITIDCGVAYGEDVAEAREVIREAVQSCQSVNQDRPIQIFLSGFGDSSMDYEVTWWTGAKPLDIRSSKDEVVEAVKKALDKANIEIPYPYRVLTFTKNEPLIYETMGREAATQESD